mgnify:CR=1 FL=1
MTISKMQHVELTSQAKIVNYSKFSLEISEPAGKAVELASTLLVQANEEDEEGGP